VDLPHHDVENFSLNSESDCNLIAQKEIERSLREIKGGFGEKIKKIPRISL